MKHHKLIVGSRFSLANETDWDPMTDYSPGIWAIESQKTALMYAKQFLAAGDTITVDCYNDPNYFALSNKFIKELGLKQELFKEVAPQSSAPVTNGKPKNLSQLKKYLTVGKLITISNYRANEKNELVETSRPTSVLAVQTNSIIVEKTLGSGIKSWLDIGKASDWTFTNEYALKSYLSKYAQGYEPSTKIIYQD